MMNFRSWWLTLSAKAIVLALLSITACSNGVVNGLVDANDDPMGDGADGSDGGMIDAGNRDDTGPDDSDDADLIDGGFSGDPDLADGDSGDTVLPAGALFVDPVGGSDSNSGSEAEPWQTIAHAFTQIGAGDTLVLRAGRYNETDLELDANGTESEPITVRNYPGEQPLIDASLMEFRTPGNDAWELVDASIHLYRAKASLENDVFVGKMMHEDSYYSLAIYSDMDADGMGNISSTEENVSAGNRYVGPGMFNDSGQLYIRLQPHSPVALHGRVMNIPANPDPSANALYIGAEVPVIKLSGSYINLTGFGIAFGRHGVDIGSSAHHINLTNLHINVGYVAVILDDGVHHVIVDGVEIEGSFPPWVAWTDMKGSEGQSLPARHWNMKCAGVNGSYVHDVEIKNSSFHRVFDGSTMEGYNIHIHDNYYLVLDDMIQLGSNSFQVEIHHNHIQGAGPSHNGKGSSPEPGTKYIYDNVIDTQIDMLWGKNDPEGILRANYSGWHGQTAFPTHTSSEIGSGDPWKIYHNTILFNGALLSGGCGIEQWTTTNSTGIAHEVYNNIIIETGGGVLVEDLSTEDGLQIYDGNLYHRQQNSEEPLWADVVDSNGSHNFDSLADFKTSATFEASKQMISTGWEAAGVEADPELGLQYAPSTDSPAATGSVALPDHFPGLRHAYRGAVAPK